MTLVVARVSGRRVAVVSDTQLTEHAVRLPIHKGVVKTYMLPGGICASFSNSPELALTDFQRFVGIIHLTNHSAMPRFGGIGHGAGNEQPRRTEQADRG